MRVFAPSTGKVETNVVTELLERLVRALGKGGRLLGIHSYGKDPGLEIVQKVWPGENPFTHSRHDLMRAAKADLGIAWDGDYDRCFFFDENGYALISEMARLSRAQSGENAKTLAEYYDRLDQGCFPTVRGLALTRDDLVRREDGFFLKLAYRFRL